MQAAIRHFLLLQHRVALFGGGARNIAPGFIASQFHQQNLPVPQAVQRQSGTDKGHRASFSCYVEGLVEEIFFRSCIFHHLT